jgi:hypothetical protein
MPVSEELNRLRERLESGLLTPEQYEDEKRGLQEQSTARSQNFLAKTGAAGRLRLTLVRGTVRDVVFLGGANKAALDVDGRKVELSLSKGSIEISLGDMVLLAGRAGDDPVRSHIYYNETTGCGSLESARKGYRLLLTAGWLGVLTGLLILIRVGLAILRERAFFSTAGIFPVLVYILLIAASASAVAVSIAFVCLGTIACKQSALVQSVVSGSTLRK